MRFFITKEIIRIIILALVITGILLGVGTVIIYYVGLAFRIHLTIVQALLITIFLNLVIGFYKGYKKYGKKKE